MDLLFGCFDKGNESFHPLAKCREGACGRSPKVRGQDRKLQAIECRIAIGIDEAQAATVAWHISGEQLMQCFRVRKRNLNDSVLVDPANVYHRRSCLSNGLDGPLSPMPTHTFPPRVPPEKWTYQHDRRSGQQQPKTKEPLATQITENY
jgi:hypothetical protein